MLKTSIIFKDRDNRKEEICLDMYNKAYNKVDIYNGFSNNDSSASGINAIKRQK